MILSTILFAFFVGFFASTIAAGPVSFLAFKYALHGRYRKSLATVFGSTLMEMIYCAIAVFSVGALYYEVGNGLMVVSRGLGSLICFAIGVYLLRHKHPTNIPSKSKPHSHKMLARAFVMSFILVACNPSIIITWSIATTLLLAFNLIILDTFVHHVFFIIAAGVGTTAGSLLVVVLIKFHKMKLSARFIQTAIRIMGVLLILLSLYFFSEFISLLDVI